ncbi:MAG: hypothetical protein PHV30_12105, partial [Candidatus Margulisbacteria bacterium]|nr:hypothetical protein [Candidatus Margulisiibacteriota bacterium]
VKQKFGFTETATEKDIISKKPDLDNILMECKDINNIDKKPNGEKNQVNEQGSKENKLDSAAMKKIIDKMLKNPDLHQSKKLFKEEESLNK